MSRLPEEMSWSVQCSVWVRIFLRCAGDSFVFMWGGGGLRVGTRGEFAAVVVRPTPCRAGPAVLVFAARGVGLTLFERIGIIVTWKTTLLRLTRPTPPQRSLAKQITLDDRAADPASARLCAQRCGMHATGRDPLRLEIFRCCRAPDGYGDGVGSFQLLSLLASGGEGWGSFTTNMPIDVQYAGRWRRRSNDRKNGSFFDPVTLATGWVGG